MKKVFFNIFAALIATFVAVSCAQEEVHTPGEPEQDGCYGVYFPSQDTKLVLDPAEPTSVEVKAVREVSTGSITVPVKLTTTSEVFTIGELKFEDGQTESSVTLDFSKSDVGVTYNCTLSIEDTQYAKKYGSAPIAIDFSVTREKWLEIGPISFIEDYYWGGINIPSTHEKAAIIYQNDADKNLFRFENPFAKRYTNFTDGSTWFTFRVLQPGDVLFKGQADYETKITESDLVYFDDFNSGYTNTNYNAKIWFCHPAGFSSTKQNQAAWALSKVAQYQPSGLPGVVTLSGFYYMFGIGGWNGSAEVCMKITFPGFVETDYSIEMEAGLTADSVVPVAMELGTDVAKVRYSVFEGRLNTAQKLSSIESLIAGTAEGAKEFSDMENPVLSVACEKTGVYTLAAVTLDEKGNGHEGATVEFTYVADADLEERATILNGGVELTEAYTSVGNDPSNSFMFYLHGKDLTAVYHGAIKASALKGATEADVIASLLEETDPVLPDTLNKINTEVYVGLETDLDPNTDYVFFAYGTNGYTYKLLACEITTDGLPLESVGQAYYTSDMWGTENLPFDVYFDPNMETPTYQALYDGELWMKFEVDVKGKKLNVPMQSANYTLQGIPLYEMESKTFYTMLEEDASAFSYSSFNAAKDVASFSVTYFGFDGMYIYTLTGADFVEILAKEPQFPSGDASVSVSKADLKGLKIDSVCKSKTIVDSFKKMMPEVNADAYTPKAASCEVTVSSSPKSGKTSAEKTAPVAYEKVK